MNLDYYSNPDTANDKWIVDLTNGKTNGYFIEAGAAKGMGDTYVLEKQLSWEGICIEPTNTFFEKLIKNRKICENVCLYSEEKEVDFIECDYETEGIVLSDSTERAGYMGWFSGIDKHLYPKFKSIHDKGEIIRKQCVTLESILDKHNAPDIIDYISLDTEGSEYEILKNFPFNKYNVMAFSIEGYRCSELLINTGYIEVKNKFCTVPYEHFYIHPGMNT